MRVPGSRVVRVKFGKSDFSLSLDQQVGEGDSALVHQLCVQMGFRQTESAVKDAADYITGTLPELLDNYPELGLFRDIVFYFKLMMCPSVDDLPPIRRWEARDAALQWTVEAVLSGMPGFRTASAMSLKVDGFGRRLTVVNIHKVQDQGMFSRLLGQSVPKPRAPPSGADLELVIEPGIATEDDILHVPNAKLPSFGGRLCFSDTELLCQFLTAPYLRIPMIVDFFREESRLRALESQDLQRILDACLFEPGAWTPDSKKQLPATIPSSERGLTACSFGLFVNELIFCPRPLLLGLKCMLEKALDFDTGNFSGQGVPVILYMVRLTVKAEEYTSAVVDLIRVSRGAVADMKQSGLPACAAMLSYASDELADELTSLCKDLTNILRGRAFDMLEQWRSKLLLAGNLSDVCEVIAHMAYIFRSADLNELADGMEDRAVKTLLTAQVFLTSNFPFNLEARDDGDMKISTDQLNRIERLEFMFGLVQKHRKRILDWIEPSETVDHGHKDKVGAVLEDVINVLTGNGRLGQASGSAPRNWASLSQPFCRGRLCPNTETEGYRAAIEDADKSQKIFQDWLQTTTTAAVGTEINMQIGVFTLRSNQTELLDAHFTESVDFKAVLGQQDARLQCAKILKTDQCEQVRLMSRHDLHFWETDPRSPKVVFRCPNLAVPQWISDGLRRVPKELLSWTVLFEDTSGDRVRGQFLLNGTLFELCLFKTFEGAHVNIFRVVSYGRRFFRTIVFSSSSVHALHNLSPSLTTMNDNEYEVCCGHQLIANVRGDRFYGRGVAVSRSLSVEIGEQMFIPKRFLAGLLPSALLGK
jgi:hypothetical protein